MFLKVLCLAIFFTYIVRKRNTDEEATEYPSVGTFQLIDDDEYDDINKVCLLNKSEDRNIPYDDTF